MIMYKGFEIKIMQDEDAGDPRTTEEQVNLWRQGEVYGYAIRAPSLVLDSLWGIYGHDEAIRQAEEAVDYIIDRDRARARADLVRSARSPEEIREVLKLAADETGLG